MSWIAVGIGVAGLGLGAASDAGAFSPSEPNLGAASAQMANVEAGLLPEQLQLEAAAQEGTSALNAGYTQSTQGDVLAQRLQGQLATLQNQLAQTQAGGRNSQSFGTSAFLNQRIAAIRSQLANIQPGQPVYVNRTGQVVPASQAVANFSGEGTAAIQGQEEEQLAQGELANAQEYDPQFIASALAQEQQANPQGVAAQQAEANLVQQQINNPPTSPVANTLNTQIGQQVAAGSNLTPEEQAMLDASVNGTVTGTSGAQPDFSQALTTGFAGEQRALENAGSGATWLSSGETPADIQFRAEQQNLANLGSEISGATPESQFSELSGAQAGPTPTSGTDYLPSFDSSAANLGESAAISQYGGQVNQALNTVNPWTAGLSTALNAGSALGRAGVL